MLNILKNIKKSPTNLLILLLNSLIIAKSLKINLLIVKILVINLIIVKTLIINLAIIKLFKIILIILIK